MVSEERLPLEGTRIIDLGTAWAAPMLSQLLADMGAEVIKVETQRRLDGLRMGRPLVGDDVAGGDQGNWPNLQPAFHGLNRNKLGITLDFKQPEELLLLKKLVEVSDVVCDNFSPGVTERAGLDYESLKAVNPGIITISLSGAGQYGPDREAVLYGASISALAGTSSLIGYYREPPLGMTSMAYGDATASIHGAFALLAALCHRNQTGSGQRIDVSETATSTSLLGEAIMDYVINGRNAKPQGNRHPFMAPHNNYPCKGEDKWVSVAVANDNEWNNLCRAMGNPAWASHEQFADGLSRWDNQSELDALISNWTKNYSAEEVTRELQAAHIAAMPVMNVEDQYFDPHFQERQTHIEIDHPLVGVETLYGIPWRLSGVTRQIRRPAPALGEHNEYVFKHLLGL